MKTTNKFMFKCESETSFNSFVKTTSLFVKLKDYCYNEETQTGEIKVFATYQLMIVIANSFYVSKIIADTIDYKKDFTGERNYKGRFAGMKIIID